MRHLCDTQFPAGFVTRLGSSVACCRLADLAAARRPSLVILAASTKSQYLHNSVSALQCIPHQEEQYAGDQASESSYQVECGTALEIVVGRCAYCR